MATLEDLLWAMDRDEQKPSVLSREEREEYVGFWEQACSSKGLNGAERARYVELRRRMLPEEKST